MGDAGSRVRAALPAEPAGLVGRERELAATTATLAAARLVTLTGPAGIGKTRLAVRAARSLMERAGRDVVWADLGSLPEACREPLRRELAAVLQGREVLLVLDGCEQLSDAAGRWVTELLAGLPGLRVLATSQRRLEAAGEAVLAVPPLAVPPEPVATAPAGPAGTAGAAAAIAGHASVRLYVERARGADPSFELTDHHAPAVARLCRALDGIPGALELAAGHAHRCPPAQALRRLTADPLAFLAGGAGRGTRVDAERTFRLATPDERLLWERLSVFAGSFDREAAAEVCGFGALGPAAADSVLRRIAPALLTETAGEGTDGADPGGAAAGGADTGVIGRGVRYRLPLSVRAYAARRLAHGTGGDAAELVRRHHDRYRVLAEYASELWWEGRQRRARALALRELPELRAAMNPMAAPGPGAALEIAVALWFLWAACGRAAEGRRHLERALALHPAPRPARALWLAAWLVSGVGQARGADPLLVEAWSAAVQEGEDTCLAYLAHVRGTVALWEARYEEAAAEYRDALDILPADPEFGPGREPLWAAYTLALAHTDPAAVPVEDGPPADPGDPWARSWAHYAHALVEWREGRPAPARAEALRALATQLELGDVLGQSFAVELLAQLEADQGRYPQAARLLGAVSGSRPVAARPPRAMALLRARMTPAAFRAAFTEGTRTPLRALLPEP
ncbi:ATP-binding protein [Streptomyces sp. NPDC090022]|uniref:ATP-binding protein n=1 Tax=Streptomyces sp. NPDC090022 TaxID=3365920 RepID=UPI00380D9135